jgi:Domain of unknown function (DUF4412)
MKKIVLSLIILCISFIPVLAQSFEGTFIMHVQDDHSVNRMSVSVRKNQLILQPLDPTLPAPVKVLMTKNSNDIFVLTEQAGVKLAIKYTFAKPAVTADSAAYSITVKETGNTKTLEGFICKEVFIDDGEGQKLQLWVTSELGFTMADFSDYLGKFSAGLNGGDYQHTVKFNSCAVYQHNMALEVREVKENDATIIFIKKIERITLAESDFSTAGYMMLNASDLPGALEQQH